MEEENRILWELLRHILRQRGVFNNPCDTTEAVTTFKFEIYAPTGKTIMIVNSN